VASTGILYLIPNVIADETQHAVIPNQVIHALKSIHYFLVEDVRTARRYLSSLKIYESIEQLHFEVLNKDTKEKDLDSLLAPLIEGKNIGVISESGCPGIADPGAMAVEWAHQKNYKVVPLVGPSSILLALMASGLNGQQFAFHGYLPIDAKEASKKIKELESDSRVKNQTQIFIETPYRNNQVLKHLLDSLHPHATNLCIASNITGKDEFIKMQTVAEWKKKVPLLAKEPTIFLFLHKG
jgi:16S rRNA (cytidine1402-2'-O)-methyltransferase